MHDLQPYPNTMRERNEKVIALHSAGFSFSQIAGLVGGISRQRAHYIVKRSRVERKCGEAKTKHPWPDVGVGEILLYRHASSKINLYISAWRWGRRHPNEDGTPKKFALRRDSNVGVEPNGDMWIVERTQ